MVKYQRPPGSIDVKINEIPEGKYRVKIVGTIVNKTSNLITINDGTGTLNLELGIHSSEGLDISKTGRFICEISNKQQNYQGKLIAWNPISREDIEKYWKLVSIERRLPRENTSQYEE